MEKPSIGLFIRVSPAVKKAMEYHAALRGISLGEYLVGLHERYLNGTEVPSHYGASPYLGRTLHLMNRASVRLFDDVEAAHQRGEVSEAIRDRVRAWDAELRAIEQEEWAPDMERRAAALESPPLVHRTRELRAARRDAAL